MRAASEMEEFGDKIKTPFSNLILETSKSDIQWRDRVWKFIEDTTSINIASEAGKDFGSFAAGAASNKIADGYMEEMVKTELTLNPV